jgi:hypothetical protein
MNSTPRFQQNPAGIGQVIVVLPRRIYFSFARPPLFRFPGMPDTEYSGHDTRRAALLTRRRFPAAPRVGAHSRWSGGVHPVFSSHALGCRPARIIAHQSVSDGRAGRATREHSGLECKPSTHSTTAQPDTGRLKNEEPDKDAEPVTDRFYSGAAACAVDQFSELIRSPKGVVQQGVNGTDLSGT